MKVRIYVEGGGDRRALLAECRRGFSELFRKMLPEGRQPHLVACGSRSAAFKDFTTALGQHTDAFVMLLVDAEGPVGSGPWKHLERRDGWVRPAGASDDHAHLMVQCMEAWFLADRDCLIAFYGQGFHAGSIPRRKEIEQVAKAEVLRALYAATKKTKTKGRYAKAQHSFTLLAKLDPDKLCRVSPHAARLRAVLLGKIAAR